MDREQAKFILHSFRPDGADVGDGDFAEALKLAAEDRELGEWLAKERSFDSLFSDAVSAIPVPHTLPDAIVSGLAIHPGDLPHPEDPFDPAMIGAFASIQPPRAMRAAIIASMEKTRASQTPTRSFRRRFALPAAAAAGIGLALFLTKKSDPGVMVVESTVPVDVVQSSFIRTFESSRFLVNDGPEQPSQTIAHLQEKKLPCPGHFPKGLRDVKSSGCRELEINGKRGSLVCFDKNGDGNKVHLIIFRRHDVCGDLPGRDHPALSQHGSWAVARWLDEDQVYVLFGATSVEELGGLF